MMLHNLWPVAKGSGTKMMLHNLWPVAKGSRTHLTNRLQGRKPGKSALPCKHEHQANRRHEMTYAKTMHQKHVHSLANINTWVNQRDMQWHA